jgi:hypothetical protein
MVREFVISFVSSGGGVGGSGVVARRERKTKIGDRRGY